MFLLLADARHGLLHNALHHVPAQTAGGVAEHISILVDHEGGGEGADHVLGERVSGKVHHHGEGVAEMCIRARFQTPEMGLMNSIKRLQPLPLI